jgi:hypothetical protein
VSGAALDQAAFQHVAEHAQHGGWAQRRQGSGRNDNGGHGSMEG